jgi:Cd2+/Zn2+-exporting ATPase
VLYTGDIIDLYIWSNFSMFTGMAIGNHSDSDLDDPWVVGLSEFLRQSQNTEALLFDRKSRKISVATLGSVDESLLSASLQRTIESIQKHPEQYEEFEKKGISVKQIPGHILLERGVPCMTAPKFWKWRDVEWPEPVPVESSGEHELEEWKLLAVSAAACGLFGLLGIFARHMEWGPAWLPNVLFVCSMIGGGWDAARDALKGVLKWQMDIHFLMIAVALGATFIGAFAEGALLLFLFSTSGALEYFALYRTKREINALFEVAPKTARVVQKNEHETSIPIEDVVKGDRVVVRPGDVFPVDARIASGSTAADESNLTGEANPVPKEVGAVVYSGTINLWGVVHAVALKAASESSLQKIIRLIQQAQHLKAPSQRFTDRFGTTYTIGVLGLTILMFFVWWLVLGVEPFVNSGEEFSAFYRAMTLLVVVSPCALVISIPSAILAAIANGARNGVLFRGGAAIEKLSEIDVVAFDKTGTLTTGELTVEQIESFPPGREKEIAETAYALENSSTHPIARAISVYGKKEGLPLREVTQFRSITGQGVSGSLTESKVILGRRELLEKGPLADWARKLPQADARHSEVWVICENLLGRILLKDQIREASASVLSELRKRSITTIMLTGDRRETSVDVGKRLGIDEIRSALSPEDKVNAVRELVEQGKKVAMIGDGVNDAPCLAAAYVSVGMGARGSDAALEQSEVVLMKDRIENFLHAYELSRRARLIIRQNITLSLGTIVLMALGASVGLVPLSLGVFAHEGSTVLVCLNSLRLLFVRNR